MPLQLSAPHESHWLTPYEHYLEAERLVTAAEEDPDGRHSQLLLAAAQVHATLATALTTIQNVEAAESLRTWMSPPPSAPPSGRCEMCVMSQAREADRLEVQHLMATQGKCSCPTCGEPSAR